MTDTREIGMSIEESLSRDIDNNLKEYFLTAEANGVDIKMRDSGKIMKKCLNEVLDIYKLQGLIL